MCNQLAEIASFSQGKCEAAMRTATHNVTITLGHKGGATEGLLVLQTSKSGGWFSNIEQPACMQGRGRVKRGSEDSSSSERRGKQCAHVEERGSHCAHVELGICAEGHVWATCPCRRKHCAFKLMALHRCAETSGLLMSEM
eukprot:scaffold72434_cov23-Tisochrysis_lutea.AAC.2